MVQMDYRDRIIYMNKKTTQPKTEKGTEAKASAKKTVSEGPITAVSAKQYASYKEAYMTHNKVAEAHNVSGNTFGASNKFAAPRVTKVVINAGTGSGIKRDRNRNDLVADRLAKITGQKPTVRGAKKSIATFKTRVADPIGVMVTLRGARMYTFLDKLIHIALPRTKDFRGLNRSQINELGNMTIGVREHTIFPETSDEDIKDVFGMAITIVTTAKSRERGLAFFEYLGLPIKKEGADDKKKKRTRKK